MDYYTFPLRTDRIMQGKHLKKVETVRSIHENISFILQSFSLSYRFDPSFGCVLNKYQALTPPQGKSERAWRDQIQEDIQKNLKDLLQRYETRIKVENVIPELQEPSPTSHNRVVKVRVEIFGQLTQGRREQFKYPDSEIAPDAMDVFPLMIPIGRNK